MIEAYLFFLGVLFFLFVVLVAIYKYSRKEKPQPIDLNDLAIVIPFRNEENSFPSFLHSLNKQKSQPKTILFVDDHSTDSSSQLIEQFISKNKHAHLISLDPSKTGKKQALLAGIQKVNNHYVITFDADVELAPRYFEHISTALPLADLYYLPVAMKGNTFISRFFAVEYLFFNAFNFLLTSFRPVSGSGANLIINRNEIDYNEQLQDHIQVSSGDDHFLLKYAQQNNKKVCFSNAPELLVYTNAPSTFLSYLKQRVRWLSKTHNKINFLEVCLGIVFFIYFLGGLLALFWTLFIGNWQLFLTVFLTRFIVDSLVFLNYSWNFKNRIAVLYLPLFQVLYPFLFIIVGVSSLFYIPKWKGRTIQK